MGAALLISFSSENTLVGKFLCSRFMVCIGLISYSLYLWHQPIISFAKIYDL
jgi:peptidoglycan/LPS O-acetylase OafA/YrhL